MAKSTRFTVSITRVETFVIDAETPDEAVDIAFSHTRCRESKARFPKSVSEWDMETTEHTVERLSRWPRPMQ